LLGLQRTASRVVRLSPEPVTTLRMQERRRSIPCAACVSSFNEFFRRRGCPGKKAANEFEIKYCRSAGDESSRESRYEEDHANQAEAEK